MAKRPSRLKALSALISRAAIASLAGRSHSDSRDIYKIAGYKEALDFNDYKGMYDREEVAAIVVDAPAKATWRTNPEIVDDEDPQNETNFEVAWKELAKRIRVFHYLERVDRLSGIGEYGVLFLGLKGGQDVEAPVTALNGIDSLLYLQAFTVDNAGIEKSVDDTEDSRFNQPEIYKLSFGSTSDDKLRKDKLVHHSRIIHVAEGLLENETFGEPRQQKIFNRLKDLQKIVSGSAEMFWKSARMGMHIDVDPEFGMGDLEGNIDAEFDKLKTELEEYDHTLTRWLRTRGAKISSLGSEVPDPSHIFKMLIALISAKTGIPQRILLGSERGEQASSQDEKNWATKVMARQEQFVEPQILRPFIDRLISIGILPEPTNKDGYQITWSNLLEATEGEKTEVFSKKMTALKDYQAASLSNPETSLIVDPNEVRQGLGFEPRSETEIEELLEELEEEPIEEEGLEAADEEVEEEVDKEEEELVAAASARVKPNGGSGVVL